jgi:hypothetical protein
MAKFIEFQIKNAALPLTEGQFLIPADDIQFAVEATAANQTTLTITMGSNGAAVYTWAVNLSTSTLGAAAAAGTVPTVTAGRPFVEALYYAMTANPGGVKSFYSPGWDQAATPLRVYVNAIA